jgi:hypothetical protein
LFHVEQLRFGSDLLLLELEKPLCSTWNNDPIATVCLQTTLCFVPLRPLV